MPKAPRKVPAYLTPAASAGAPNSMAKPIIPRKEVLMLHNPRALVRSASQPMKTVTTAATENGVSCCVDFVRLYLKLQSGRLTSVRRHRQQIRLGARDTRIELLNNRGQKQRERIQRAIAAHVDHRKRPRLPVFDRSPKVCHLELFMLSGGLTIDFQTV